MSVFTPVSPAEARAFIAPYRVGEIIDFQNIAAGAENSNFFVTTNLGRFVLTLFEKIPREDLAFYLGLMTHLHEHGLPVAAPIRTESGEVLRTLNGKPAVLVSRLNGNDTAHPSVADCAGIGTALAKLHLASASFALKMPNWRGLSWWKQFSVALHPHLTASENRLIAAELAFQAGFDALTLPRGIIHADLFRDNVLWDERSGSGTHTERVPQMIDFYFACEDYLLYDVAICVNDWCLDFPRYPAAALDQTKTAALLSAYHALRPFTAAERAAWSQMLRAGALRFWLGRLGYHHFPVDLAPKHPRDHAFLERLLRHHIEHAAKLTFDLPSTSIQA